MLPSQRLAGQGSRWRTVQTNIDDIVSYRSDSGGHHSKPQTPCKSQDSSPAPHKDGVKHAGNSFKADELYELNGADFW